MEPIVRPEALDPDAVLLDVRMGSDAHDRYLRAHLGGARFVDVERDLSGDTSEPARGGRHPLPPIAQWAATLGRLGIRPDSVVVAYDDAGGAKAAARLWWMLRASGHERVAVLDGGLDAAVKAGVRITSELPPWEPAPPYPVEAWSLPIASLEDVDVRRTDPDWRVLDVRSADRFRGRNEPYDPPGGHIAGARNVPLVENLDPYGRFKAPATLRALYEGFLDGVTPEHLVVSCGSGITACHTLLALERAGMPGAALYVGSFSEWSRNARPVAREEEP